MINTYNKTLHNHPCRLWRGFFVFVIIVTGQAVAMPAVGLIMGKNGDDCRVTIYGVSIGAFKEGKITCQYDPAVEIEDALIGSPVTSISIGASIDKNNRKLTIYLSVTRKVNIDSSYMGILQFPVNGILDNSIFSLIDATFINEKGESFYPVILPAASVMNKHVKVGNKSAAFQKYYILNGRLVDNKIMKNLEKKSVGQGIPIRVLKW